MILKYATLTHTYSGGLFGKYEYILKFLTDVETINLNVSDKNNEGKIFDKFDEGVAFLGGLGYNLCSVVPSVNSVEVEKAWFSKEIKTV